jgi:hypothetical protein
LDWFGAELDLSSLLSSKSSANLLAKSVLPGVVFSNKATTNNCPTLSDDERSVREQNPLLKDTLGKNLEKLDLLPPPVHHRVSTALSMAFTSFPGRGCKRIEITWFRIPDSKECIMSAAVAVLIQDVLGPRSIP